MTKNRTIRVFPDGNVWVAKKDGSTRASAVRDTKEEALRAAREIAIKQGLTIIIHGRDGRIQKTVRPGNSSSEGCFITSACVQYYGLADDCYQLQTLRNFRDFYLLNTPKGKTLVDKYYRIGPRLVSLLENDPHKKYFFRKIFNQINDACQVIDSGNFIKAVEIYKNIVKQLLQHFKYK